MPSTDQILTEILKKLDRMERKLSMQMQEEKKSVTWVKANVITRITGWDRNGMSRARANGYVKYKKEGDVFWYNLDSVHPVHHKKVEA